MQNLYRYSKTLGLKSVWSNFERNRPSNFLRCSKSLINLGFGSLTAGAKIWGLSHDYGENQGVFGVFSAGGEPVAMDHLELRNITKTHWFLPPYLVAEKGEEGGVKTNGSPLIADLN